LDACSLSLVASIATDDPLLRAISTSIAVGAGGLSGMGGKMRIFGRFGLNIAFVTSQYGLAYVLGAVILLYTPLILPGIALEMLRWLEAVFGP
jgi:hypothetical protein